MNEDKTDVLFVTAKRIVNLQHLPEFMNINGTHVKFIPSVRNLGVTLDSTLSLHQHVMNVCRVAYLELRPINSIRNLLSIDAVKTLVCSLVLSRLDYCNSMSSPYLLVFLGILLRGFKESKMRQPDQYLEHPGLSTSHHSSRTFTGYLSIGEPYPRLLHYVILHYLALVLNTCLTLLMFTPLLDPCTLPQILVS